MTLARRCGVVEGRDAAAVVLGLDHRTGSRSTTVTLAPRSRARQRDSLPHGSEPDHDDLATVERQAGDRGERRPGLDADVVTVVDELLQGDPVPVQHRERDVDSVEPVQTGCGGLQRAGGAMSRGGRRSDELASHVAERISRFACQPGERIRMLGDAHPRPSADLDPDRGEVGSSTIICAVPIARRHAHARPSFDEWSDDANGVGEDVLVARDRPTLKIPRRDFDTERGRDRSRPRYPLELRSVHGDK